MWVKHSPEGMGTEKLCVMRTYAGDHQAHDHHNVALPPVVWCEHSLRFARIEEERWFDVLQVSVRDLR
jgi:hypothetical protein